VVMEVVVVAGELVLIDVMGLVVGEVVVPCCCTVFR